MTALVIGATGNVGRHVVRQLVELGQPVRAITRDPNHADFPPEVEVVAGDLTDVPSLHRASVGVTAAHLICFAGDSYEPLQYGAELVETFEAGGTRHVTVLKGDTNMTAVEAAVMGSSMEWTILAPVEFMGNTLYWVPGILDGRLAEGFLDTPSTVVHEANIGDVAAHVLTDGGHHGETLWITGPEVLTGHDRIRIIKAETGRQFDVASLSPAEVEEDWRSAGFTESVIAYMNAMRKTPPVAAQVPQDTMYRITNHPPRHFRDWVREHRGVFTVAASKAARGSGLRLE